MKYPYGLTLCQKKKKMDMLKAFGMHDCKSVKTPIETFHANLEEVEGCFVEDINRLSINGRKIDLSYHFKTRYCICH